MKPHPEPTDTPYRQIGEFEDLASFIAHARMSTDEVEASTKMAAMGYWVEDEYFNKKGEKKLVRRWIPPSDRARDLYLKNMKPDEWNRENEKQVDTSAIERLDAILSSLTLSAQAEQQEDNNEDENNETFDSA